MTKLLVLLGTDGCCTVIYRMLQGEVLMVLIGYSFTAIARERIGIAD